MIHKDYKRMQSRWVMCRDAMAGEYEVHDKTTTYLPALNQEKAKDYQTRLAMTPFFGASWRTIIALRGMMFRKDPDINVPDSIIDSLDNIDNTGQSFISFAQDVALEGLAVGRSGVLTDFSEVPDGITLRDVNEIGFGPFLTMYVAESILDWNHINIGGRKVLSMVRLKEDSGNYQEIELNGSDEIHRILSLTDVGYTQQLVIASGDDDLPISDLIIPRMNGSAINFIPFQPIGVDTLSMSVEIPPLIDLVTMNFHHYRQSSSYERGCFLTGFPTLFVYGNQDDEKIIYMGGGSANSFPDYQTRAEFVSADTKLEALERNLDRKERQMAVLGARMLESQKKGVESAETWQRKQSGEESILSDMSTTISEGLTNSLKWYTEWTGEDSTDVNIELNKEFLPFDMNAQQITAMMGAYIQKGLSYKTLYHNFERAGMYPPESNEDDEKGMIDEGNPGL